MNANKTVMSKVVATVATTFNHRLFELLKREEDFPKDARTCPQTKEQLIVVDTRELIETKKKCEYDFVLCRQCTFSAQLGTRSRQWKTETRVEQMSSHFCFSVTPNTKRGVHQPNQSGCVIFPNCTFITPNKNLTSNKIGYPEITPIHHPKEP